MERCYFLTPFSVLKKSGKNHKNNHLFSRLPTNLKTLASPPLVPHFAWPNPELACFPNSTLLCSRKIAHICFARMPKSATQQVVLATHMTWWHYAPLHIMHTENLPICQKQPCVHLPYSATRWWSPAYLPKSAKIGRSSGGLSAQFSY